MSTHYNMGTQDFHPSFLDYTPLLVCDFTTLAPGLASTLFGLSHTRASAATVQTGTSTIFSSLLVDQAGIGRALDADPAALVIDESRTNLVTDNRGYVTGWSATGTGATFTAGFSAGVDGTAGKAARMTTPAGDYCRYINITIVQGARYAYTAFHRGAVSDGLWSWWEWADNAKSNGSITLAQWQRISRVVTSTGTNGLFSTADCQGQAFSVDVLIDVPQVEQGAFPTEAIITISSPATRAGARLWHPSLNQIMTGGRLSMRAILQAKGATTDYATSPYLWFANASNYATISNSTGAVTLVINGASYTTAGGVTWAQGDVLDIRIMAGGGVSNSVVKIGKNGGALTTLGTSPAPQAAIPAGLALDLLQDSTAANVLSSRLRTLSFYRPGALEVLP